MTVTKQQLDEMRDNKKVRELLNIPIRWYIKQVTPSGMALCIPYQTRQDYEKVLNHFCGSDWSNEHRSLNEKMYCSISVMTDEGVTERMAAGTTTNIESTKGEDSDAFKRTAMRFGIFSDVFEIGGKMIKGKKEGRTNVGLTDNGTELRTKEQISAYCNALNSGIGYLRSIYLENKAAFDSHPEAMNAMGIIKEFLGKVKQ